MKKFLLASFATLSITAAGVGISASSSDAHAAETTQASQSTESVHQQFLNAGGTEELWQKVVLLESGGNPNAVNELGYQGLGQTKESWGTGSVEEQTKGMVQYAKERYGSIDAAISFREANGWW